MDIFIRNVPGNTNHNELRIFLRDKLAKFDVLAFEVIKKVGNTWAILRIAQPTKANLFLIHHGNFNPMTALMFRGAQLDCGKSNKPGQPDALAIIALQQKDNAMRTKQSKKGPETKHSKQSQSIFQFKSLATGVWMYDDLEKLIFDQKYKDQRQGAITFGKSTLVIYLQAAVHRDWSTHFRIDIPYWSLEHTITSAGNGNQGTLTFTLKAPPKIYEIRSTNDLHLYSGEHAPPPTGLEDTFQALSFQQDVKRLRRQCCIHRSYPRNPALCMVYMVVLPNQRLTHDAFAFVRELSALPEVQAWKTMVPSVPTYPIEYDYMAFLDELNQDLYGGLSFGIRFQLQALVLEGTITPLMMRTLIKYVCSVALSYDHDVVARAVRRLGFQIPTPGPGVSAEDWSLQHFRNLIEENVKNIVANEMTSSGVQQRQKKHYHLSYTYKATVTPTGLLLRGPESGVSNRVLRKYSQYTEYFIRVFFADEDGTSVLHDPRADQEDVYRRFRDVLCNGIEIAGRSYEFLGFSHSSLHFHTAWFMAPFYIKRQQITARDVIADLGDFTHIHCSAKCAARIGQAFSDTLFAIHLPQTVYVTEQKPDVERNGRCFSDGCGTISKALLERVWRALPPDRRMQRPTILQIRYRGAKGVVSLDTSLDGEQLHIRKSMTKYSASESWRDLEICGAAYKPLPMYLNHQFIKILEDLGVPPKNIAGVQDEALKSLELVVKHPINAASFLEYSRSGTAARIPSLFMLMHEIGLSFQADKFLTDIVEVAAMSNLRDMKYRARIPVSDGYLLYGIMDETGELQENEVYIATSEPSENGPGRVSPRVGSRVVVTRAPALHPGDVQIVRAVNPRNPRLQALHNCIVFSQHGPRDLPSQLSGGDLDGDLFHIIFDDRLIPSYTEAPADYPPTSALDLGRPVRVGDIVDFFIEYMKSDRLGQISNKHKIRSDVEAQGTKHEDCIKLAKLASDAVDFSKSGRPVNMAEVPKNADHIRPDFMANGPGLVLNQRGAAELEDLNEDDIDNPDSISLLDPDKARIRYYKSSKILGHLYRRIDEIQFFSRMKEDFEESRSAQRGKSLMETLWAYVLRETGGVQYEHHRRFAEDLRECYEEDMLEIMDTLRPHRGKPLTELEVFSGNILGKKERASTRYIREANAEVQECFNRKVSAFVRQIVSGDDDEDREEALPRAIMCFKVSLEKEGWESYNMLRSWKYVAAAVCLEELSQYMNFRLRPI